MNKIKTYLIFIVLLIIAVIITYSNHFYNGFQFDDTHTIIDNIYIRDIGNFFTFFTDIRTFGAMSDNLGYRPVVTASTAIDYWMGGGYNQFYFHLSMFTVYLFQGILLLFFVLKIFNLSYNHNWTKYIAFFTVSWYMLHPGNAETINYIIARSDSFSTFFMILAFVCYIYSGVCRKFYLYLIPVALGCLSKETTAMFPLLLFMYILLFENKVSITNIFTLQRKLFLNSIVKVLPALFFTLALSIMVQYICYANTSSSGMIHAGVNSNHFYYILTQPYVLFLYFCNYFLPLSLSSDTDLTVFKNFSDYRMYSGFAFVIVMFIVAIYASKNEKHRPIAFGIFWFFIAAIPTSILAALTQVANSHRLFFLFVGLSIAVGWSLYILLLKIEPLITRKKFSTALFVLGILVLSAYAYGTYQRNKVWKSPETLWADILEKGPDNPRALANYGLIFSGKGDNKTAEKYLIKALKKWPGFNYILFNLGIVNKKMGNFEKAEVYFKKAVAYHDNSMSSFFYGEFLYEQMRYSEAVTYLEKSMKISQSNPNARLLLMHIYNKLEEWDKLKELSESILQILPKDPRVLDYHQKSINRKGTISIAEEVAFRNPDFNNYLTLSFVYLQKERYEKCIIAARNALKINPDLSEAYSNMGCAFIGLKKYDSAIVVSRQALNINPENHLAKNNFELANSELNKFANSKKITNRIKDMEAAVETDPSEENYIVLSMLYYQDGLYEKCIVASAKTIEIEPENADAYSNMAASFNQLKQWDKATEASRKALEINPNHQAALQNKKWARDKKR